ncbi:MAG: TIGR04100 family radical SAM protein [Acutalibacteraceae bacterium]|nr:TIGR04100 family radical SAM protein [Acutalibacteraceae bacterium]
MGDIVYSYGNSAYLNITNKCCCSCVFCVRGQKDAIGSASSLWHEKEPTLNQIFSAIDEFDFTNFTEVVFCGYGEPTCALDNLIAICEYIRERYQMKIRLNTNGLSDLINKKPTAKILGDYLDEVSISLNAPTKQKYLEVTRPSFGEQSFDAMLAFAKECKEYVKSVKMSIVDTIPKDDIEKSKALADSLGIPLRIRHYTE